MLKILVNNINDDPRFNSLVAPVHSLPATVGRCGKEIDTEELNKFAPNLILTNAEETDIFKKLKSNPVVIPVNNSNTPDSFSFENTQSNNYISPFVVKRDKSPVNDERYKCDVSFIGDMAVFGKAGLKLVNDTRIVTKFFLHTPTPFAGYCGYCDPTNYPKLYAMSKVNLVDNTNQYRIMDIIYNDGYVVIKDQEESEEALLKHVYEVIFEGKKKRLPITKQEIQKKHTNNKRISSIFAKVGLTKFSNHLLQNGK